MPTDVNGSPHLPRPDWIDSGRIPCLDGLRAIAILLVYYSHACYARRGVTRWPFPPWFGRRFDAGRFGVDIFFVISGFLITILLFRENERSGQISLKGFYIRRSLRILPAYVTYLLFVALVWDVDGSLSVLDWIGPLTFTSNFFEPSILLGHTWSLSVEEQFYLCWPLILATLGRRRAIIPLLAIVAIAPFARAFASKYWTETLGDRAVPSDAIAVGCLLAYVTTSCPRVVAWFERHAAMILIASVLAVGFILYGAGPVRVPCRFMPTLRAAVIAAGILAAVGMNKRSIFRQVLESRPAVWIGGISYSLYLWQQPFLMRRIDTQAGLVVALLVSVAAAVVSHYAIERPFLSLKGRRLGRNVSRAKVQSVG